MRLLGLDLETTGLDVEADRITEIGIVLWDTETKSAIFAGGYYLYDKTYPKVPPEVVKITGITDDILKEFGQDPKAVLKWIDEQTDRWKVDYVVAHNGQAFDRPFLGWELSRNDVPGATLKTIPWIDTRYDIPWKKHMNSLKLGHIALEHGFMNPFGAHRAMMDVFTMLKVLAQYDIAKVVEYSKVPNIVVRALVDYPDRQKAKDKKFSWEQLSNYQKYPKYWVKMIKADQLETLKQQCDFSIAVLKGKPNG